MKHTIGVCGSCNLSEFSLSNNFADNTLDFVPSGSPVTKVRDLIRTAACNKRHDQMGFHGGSRRSLELCILCHRSQTPNAATLNTVHFGANLPSVKAGKPYKIGNTDYSTVVCPSPAMDCKVCHEPKEIAGATRDTKWKTGPNRIACGACHDEANFNTGENHAGQPQPSDNPCETCHQPKGNFDFDTSITGAHMIPVELSLLAGVVFEITGASNVGVGTNPVVTFTVGDNNVRLYMGGLTGDIAGYVREDVLKAEGPGDGRNFWTFASAIPATATGTWQFGIEGYRTTIVLVGPQKERTIRHYGINKMFYAGLDGTKAAPRRVVASTAISNKCHYSLEFHGGDRNTVEQCSICHNTSLTRKVNGKDESLNLVNMIHRSHSAIICHPGILSDCNQCHVNNSQNPRLKAKLSVTDGSAPYTLAPPTTNACLSCHNTNAAWSHVLANTTIPSESCTIWHSNTSEFSVGKVHAQ